MSLESLAPHMIYVMSKIKEVAIFWFHTSIHFDALMVPSDDTGYQLIKPFREKTGKNKKNLLIYSTYTC